MIYYPHSAISMAHSMSPSRGEKSFSGDNMGPSPEGDGVHPSMSQENAFTSTPHLPSLGRGRAHILRENLTGRKNLLPGDNLSSQGRLLPPEHDTSSFRYMPVAPFVPKLPIFSGEDTKGSGDTIYSEWRFEVQCLISDPEVTDHLTIQAIRRSLKGTARKVMIPLGERASIEDILNKLDAMFGDVSSKGMIMQEFLMHLKNLMNL